MPTAGGNNPDVLGAISCIAEKEPLNLLVLCGNVNSKAAQVCSRYQYVDFISFALPAGKDGFLATNSLLAFCILLARAYAENAGQKHGLPSRLSELLPFAFPPTGLEALDMRVAPLLAKKTIVVLHGSDTTTAAVDIESKFTEAALGNVQICDYRQFAHGRHHWLAKYRDDTAIVALESPTDAPLASQILKQLPEEVPIERLLIPYSDWKADLSATIGGFHLVSAAGRARRIDPGRPGVPPFGRRIYHANAFPAITKAEAMESWRNRVLARKASLASIQLASAEYRKSLASSLSDFIANLNTARFVGLVLDYDGTLCYACERFGSLPTDVTHALLPLLHSGLLLGIATGRGKSVRESMRAQIPPQYWRQILIGYYNGSEMITLEDAGEPNNLDDLTPELNGVQKWIKRDKFLSRISRDGVEYRPSQITLKPTFGISVDTLFERAYMLCEQHSKGLVKVLTSGHSVDIVPVNSSKLSVCSGLRSMAGATRDAPVLRIGDRGCWPGNDCELLACEHGLSVHEVSSDPGSCWNLAPRGLRGRQGTIAYLKWMRLTKNGLRINIPFLGKP